MTRRQIMSALRGVRKKLWQGGLREARELGPIAKQLVRDLLAAGVTSECLKGEAKRRREREKCRRKISPCPANGSNGASA